MDSFYNEKYLNQQKMKNQRKKSFVRKNSHLRNLMQTIIVCAWLMTSPGIMKNSYAQGTTTQRPDVVAVYYPHWHNYDHGSSWKGEGWTEWVEMAAAKPKFPGHEQPKVCTWGDFDESDPKWVAKEIDLAADHGIDVFMYDWYWYSGVRTMEEALEQGFLKAKNRNRMKFALMWANHDRRDQFYPEHGAPRTVWFPIRHSSNDLTRVIDYCIENYFKEPNYWKVDGGLFFSIYRAENFVKEIGGQEKTKALFDEMNEKLKEACLPPMHWSGMVLTPEGAELLKKAGFSSTSRYNIKSGKVDPDFTEKYEDMMDAHVKHWEKMTSKSSLVNIPVVTMGWDATPRCRQDVPWPYSLKEYPYVPVVVGNTPKRFEQLLQDAANHCKNDPHHPYGVLLNAWNEWTEGCYLLPESRTGTAYLEAIKNVFGTKDH